MAGGLADLDTGFPEQRGSTEKQLRAVYDYLVLLLENLRYILRNLSPENFNQAEVTDWLKDKIEAKTILSDTVITNELYAEYGAIADLVVDELRTDYQKAARYLAGDTSAIDYLHIYDENIDFVTGTVRMEEGEPATEQLRNVSRVYGTRYFWWTDASRTQMTSMEETPYPVTVYVYDELLKGSIRFQDYTSGGVTTKIPVFILGAGVGNAEHPDYGKGFLRKESDSLNLWLRNSSGADHGIYIGEQYTDLVGLRKTTEIDFSGWDNGSFTETVDGEIANAYAVAFDALGRPVKITDGDGHETAVAWPETGGGE